jgi:hypothetical protein
MLKARDVQEEQDARREQRMSAMRPVLSQIYGQIRRQAVHAPNAPYIVFEIPTYVFGYPIFQLNEARDYLLQSLTTSGFMVWPVNEKYLLISWVKQPGTRNTQHRPPLVTNYRPMPYDLSQLGSMTQLR